jgi:HEAT repeat protein
MDRRALPQVHLAAIEALGTFGGAAGVDALKVALHQGDWWAPLRTRRQRAAAAGSLRRLGSPSALDVLRAASTHGPLGVRFAARAELARID